MKDEKPEAKRVMDIEGIRGRLTLGGAIAGSCLAGLVVVAVAPWPCPITFLWAFASTAAGSALGFVFGVPRQQGAQADSAVSHPNLDRLSEWITGLVVGATLVQAKEIPPYLWSLAGKLARGLVGADAHDEAKLAPAQAFAVAVIVYFFLMGVIGGYLATRLLLAGMKPTVEVGETVPTR